jgi:hypothetical protein
MNNVQHGGIAVAAVLGSAILLLGLQASAMLGRTFIQIAEAQSSRQRDNRLQIGASSGITNPSGAYHDESWRSAKSMDTGPLAPNKICWYVTHAFQALYRARANCTSTM